MQPRSQNDPMVRSAKDTPNKVLFCLSGGSQSQGCSCPTAHTHMQGGLLSPPHHRLVHRLHHRLLRHHPCLFTCPYTSTQLVYKHAHRCWCARAKCCISQPAYGTRSPPSTSPLSASCSAVPHERWSRPTTGCSRQTEITNCGFCAELVSNTQHSCCGLGS